MSKSQVAYNMKVQGGFLPLLAGLASQALPFLTCTVLPALGEAVPKSSRGWKWKNLLRRIWKDKSQYEGQGIGRTVVIPSDPDALLDSLDILLASKAAGNTWVRNEIVSICDELLRQF